MKANEHSSWSSSLAYRPPGLLIPVGTNDLEHETSILRLLSFLCDMEYEQILCRSYVFYVNIHFYLARILKYFNVSDTFAAFETFIRCQPHITE
jgi:hypothetical protein